MKKSSSFSTHQLQNSLQFDLYALIYCTLYVELITLETSFKIQSFLISETLGRRTFIHHSPTLVAQKPKQFFHQHIIYHKTTCGFTQNDVMFFIKRRIVFHKTTRHFFQSENVHWRWTLYNCKNTYNHFPSRARVYARFQGVFIFLLSQVSQHPL